MSFKGTSRSFSSSSLSGSMGSRGSLFGALSPSTIGNLANTMRPYVQINSSTFPQADDKETMKGLNDRLGDYLSKVRLLEESNSKLEEQIKEALMRKGAESGRDWSAYERIIADLRNQIQEMNLDNARLFLQIDNARLAADDFKVKFESEQGMRQGVEQDLARLRKMLDDTYMGRMQLESQIESMREELAFLKKSHEEDVAGLQNQISNCQVNVQMDSKNSPDLNETITNIRTQYERAAQKSREETEAWYQNKFDNITAEVTQNTEALQAGKTELNDLRRQKQSLEIDLQALHNMIRSLEDSLHETEARYGREVSGYNSQILQLEGELGQVRAQVERHTAEYEALLNIKSKLEAEIASYHHLLEGVVEDKGDKNREEFSLEQALYAAPPPPSSVGLKKAIIITQEIVDGEVVSQSELEQNPTNHNSQKIWGEVEDEFAELQELVEEERTTTQQASVDQSVEEEKKPAERDEEEASLNLSEENGKKPAECDKEEASLNLSEENGKKPAECDEESSLNVSVEKEKKPAECDEEEVSLNLSEENGKKPAECDEEEVSLNLSEENGKKPAECDEEEASLNVEEENE